MKTVWSTMRDRGGPARGELRTTRAGSDHPLLAYEAAEIERKAEFVANPQRMVCPQARESPVEFYSELRLPGKS